MTTLIELDAFLIRAIAQRKGKGAAANATKRPVASAWDLAERCAAKITVKNHFAPAYLIEEDIIVIPSRPQRLLRRPKQLANAILHELTHWSGASSRLNRIHFGRAFDTAYNREELIAEIGAVLLGVDLGITDRPILPNHKYLANYLASIDRPDVALHVALGQAQQAASFLHMIAARG